MMKDRTIFLHGDDPEAKREEIRLYFHASYDLDEQLFDVMAKDEAYYRRADPLRHPLIFYLGHTATFYINKLIMGKALDERVDPRFESMFAIGVDEMSWDDLDETPLRLARRRGCPGLPPPRARGGGRAHPLAAPHAADRLGPSLLGDPDGHRAFPHPRGDLLRAHSPAAPGAAAPE